MDLEPPSYYSYFSLGCIALVSFWQVSFEAVLLLCLIICSALISGSEVAFFSLNSRDQRQLEDEDSSVANTILALKEKPKRLLGTILISNNFVNIAIVIVTQLIIDQLLPPERLAIIGDQLSAWTSGLVSGGAIALGFNFFLTVVVVTFILVLFGEVAPKIYANIDNLRFAKIMAKPLSILSFIFNPISSVLVGWGDGIEKRISDNRNYQTGSSKEDLDTAIELAVMNEEDSAQDLDLLKGIINFGDLSAKQIMKPRVDVTAFELTSPYSEIIQMVKDSGYSRIPVYEEDFDKVTGILYVKDLLGHIEEHDDFQWQDLIRTNTLFVPESKKIDDLLREFQLKRQHMAIVVNEYGGTEGIITLEDIMEEVIGDIKDEFDEIEDVQYIQVGRNNFIFEAKSLLHDVSKVIGEAPSYFDDVRGNADSIGGLIIEHLGVIPQVDNELVIKDITLKIISVTNRKIEKVNLKVKKKDD